VRAENARVTPDDNWAADGLDVMTFSYTYFEDHYSGVKCELSWLRATVAPARRPGCVLC
jgi:hypothetical protein